MGLGRCDNHGHLTNKSHAQTRKCKWLVQMKPTLGCGFAFGFIIFTWLGLKNNPPPSSL
jgi:hypothetical protein